MKPIGFIVPAQPVGAKVPPAGPGWLHEIKHDGFRLMSWRNSDRVRLLTRNGTDFTDRFPLVAEAIGKLPARSCLIDGEIAVCNGMGLSVFDMLRQGPRIKRNAVLFSFDLLELDRRDLRMEPIESRKAELEKLLRGAPASLHWLEHLEVEGPVMFELVCALGAEGIVSKWKGSRHASSVIHQRCPKAFFVSPFMDMELQYEFRLSGPDERLSLGIAACDAKGTMFNAVLAAGREELTDRALLRLGLTMPLLTLKVIAGIHWQALRLWLKGVGFQRRSAPRVAGLGSAADTHITTLD